MPPMPSEPASIPTTRNSSAKGTPSRAEARLDITLIVSSAPTPANMSPVAKGSAVSTSASETSSVSAGSGAAAIAAAPPVSSSTIYIYNLPTHPAGARSVAEACVLRVQLARVVLHRRLLQHEIVLRRRRGTRRLNVLRPCLRDLDERRRARLISCLGHRHGLRGRVELRLCRGQLILG